MELSGFAGLNTGEVWRSKPVLAKAEDDRRKTQVNEQRQKLCCKAQGVKAPTPGNQLVVSYKPVKNAR